jgi:formate hydrogenlyase subunit 6/NADH:ubiquinone oxidoreductase subunit I
VLTVGAPVWIDFDESCCTGCAWCVDVCSEKVFSIKRTQFNNHSEKKVKINIENCINCGNCVDVCKPKGIVDHSYNHIQSYHKTQLASNIDDFFSNNFK